MKNGKATICDPDTGRPIDVCWTQKTIYKMLKQRKQSAAT